MRETPTAAEDYLLGRLLEHLRTSDVDVREIVRDVRDRPDLAIVYQGRKIACECTQIPPSEIFQWVHRRIPSSHDSFYCAAVVWAEEPHSWVLDAATQKSAGVDDYRRAVDADEVWLLVHTPLNDSQVFVRGEFPWEAQMLRYGASQAEHGFDRIVFWEPKCGFQTIHTHGQDTPPVQFDLTGGYPTRSFAVFGGFPFTTTEHGEPPRHYEYGPLRPDLIIVPPIDPAFRGLEPRYRRR